MVRVAALMSLALMIVFFSIGQCRKHRYCVRVSKRQSGIGDVYVRATRVIEGENR